MRARDYIESALVEAMRKLLGDTSLTEDQVRAKVTISEDRIDRTALALAGGADQVKTVEKRLDRPAILYLLEDTDRLRTIDVDLQNISGVEYYEIETRNRIANIARNMIDAVIGQLDQDGALTQILTQYSERSSISEQEGGYYAHVAVVGIIGSGLAVT